MFKALKDAMFDILEELRRIENGANVDDELLETINIVSAVFKELASPEKEVTPMSP